MLSTLISFLGGSVFRMIWGEVSAWLTSRQDHKHEIERMRLQAELDAAQHLRMQETVRLQAELGVKTIQVQGEADLSKIDADVFGRGVESIGQKTGYALVDIWKGLVQPVLATICIILVVLNFHEKGWVLDERGWELCGAVLGLFVADRLLFRRGK